MCREGGSHTLLHLGGSVWLCTRGGEIVWIDQPVWGRALGMPSLGAEVEQFYRMEQWS